MILSTGERVLSAMGVGVSPSAVRSAEDSLRSVLPIIERMVESRLSRVHAVDYFDFTPSTRSAKSQPVTLRLSGRFLDTSTGVGSTGMTPVLRLSDVCSPLVGVDGDVVRSDLYSYNTDLGLVTLDKSVTYQVSCLSVEYVYGRTYVPGEVPTFPSWVEDAAVTAAVMAQNTLPSTPANRKQRTVTEVTTSIYGMLAMQIQQYVRPRMTVEPHSRTIALA